MASFPLRRDSDVQERPTEQSSQQQDQQMLNVPLGTLIYRAGLVSQEALQEALQESIRSEKMLGEVLLERGMVEERELGRLLAGQKGLPFVDLDRINVDHDAARRLPENVAREHSALPVAVDPQGTPLVAVANPSPSVVAAVAQVFGAEPHVGVAARDELLRTIDLVYGGPAAEQPSLRLAHVDEFEVHEATEEEVAPAPLRVEPWAHASEDERVEEPTDEETEDDDTFDEIDEDRVAPTASLAEAPEPVEEDTSAEDEASESVDDEKPIFAWGERSVAPTEDASAETETMTGSFVDASQSFDEDVAELDASSEAFAATEEDDDPEELTAATYEVDEATDESVHEAAEPSSNGWHHEPSFGEQPVLALVAAEDEPETVEHSFDDTESSLGVAELETFTETEAVDEAVAEATDEAVLDDDEVDADELAPVAAELAEDDAEVEVIDDAVEAEAAAEVFITLANGERLSSGRFASEREAVAHAQSLLSDLRREWWPKVGARLIRPEAVISIDLETE